MITGSPAAGASEGIRPSEARLQRRIALKRCMRTLPYLRWALCRVPAITYSVGAYRLHTDCSGDRQRRTSAHARATNKSEAQMAIGCMHGFRWEAAEY